MKAACLTVLVNLLKSSTSHSLAGSSLGTVKVCDSNTLDVSLPLYPECTSPATSPYPDVMSLNLPKELSEMDSIPKATINLYSVLAAWLTRSQKLCLPASLIKLLPVTVCCCKRETYTKSRTLNMAGFDPAIDHFPEDTIHCRTFKLRMFLLGPSPGGTLLLKLDLQSTTCLLA